ncbi:hypothetical protein GW17_00055987 [Ensete ventricosum]|nr:hypothetical protein GW17_00055987 [Ensete ventricosum]
MATLGVADICRKMAAKRSESEGSSDDGGRRGQQQCRLRLHCDFVAASGIGCSKGAAAIGERWAAVCTAVAEEGSSGFWGCDGRGCRLGKDGFRSRRYGRKEDDSRLMDLRLGGRRWMKATSKAIVGIAWKMEVAEMAIGQQERGSDTR